MADKNQWLIDLGREDIWAEEIGNIPSMLDYSYHLLRYLVENGRVYGSMLQCQNFYEALMKIPVIMCLIVIENEPANKDRKEYSEVIRRALEQPLSMGSWYELACRIKKRRATLGIPDTLSDILTRTADLYQLEVTEKYQDVVNWRNSEVGHGALRFEDDPAYQQELRNLLVHIKDYFEDGINVLYGNACFLTGNEKLADRKDCTPESQPAVILRVEGVDYTIRNYIDDKELKVFLFDSFYSKRKEIKYTSYADGQEEIKKNDFFSRLYDQFVLKGTADFELAAQLITREQEQILECLHMPPEYIEPKILVGMLRDQMEQLDHGIITVKMERGTGKSALASRMNGLYYQKSLVRGAFARSYHIRNASLRGVEDFINAVNFSFRHSYDSGRDLYGASEELLSLSLNDDNKPAAMARFLNYYHRKYDQEYTVLLIDGIDELTPETEEILGFIPSSADLDEGVFVILLSRFADENTVAGRSREYVSRAEQFADAVIGVRRTDEANLEPLEKCLDQWRKKTGGTVDTAELLKKADHRFLYLKAYLALPQDMVLDSKDEYAFIRSYMENLLSLYGPRQQHKIREIAAVIALFPSVTLNQYQDYLNCLSLTYEFIGLFNDLMPLLTVMHADGEACYEFADQAYREFVLREYPDAVMEVLHFFEQSFDNILLPVFHSSYIMYVTENMTEAEKSRFCEDVSFFSERYVNLWQEAQKNTLLSDALYRDDRICQLVEKMKYDRSWGAMAYNQYLLQRMEGLIIDALLNAPRNGRGWVEKLRSLLINGTGNEYEPLSSLHNPLRRYYSGHREATLVSVAASSHPEEWVWLFKESEDFIPEEIDFIRKNDLTDALCDYLINTGYDMGSSLIPPLSVLGALLNHISDPETEQKILNRAVDFCLNAKAPGPSSSDWRPTFIDRLPEAVDFLNTMVEKGYSVNIPGYEGDPADLMEMLVDRSVQNISGLLSDAIREVKDIESVQSEKLIGEFSSCMKVFGFLDDKEIYLSEEQDVPLSVSISELLQFYDAIYQLMVHKREAGVFCLFFYELKAKRLFDIIMVHAGIDADRMSELDQWIGPLGEELKVHVCNTICFLARMQMEKILLYGENDQMNEMTEAFLDYIYHTETRARFFSYLGGLETGVIPHLFFRDSNILYCTENTLILLLHLREQGREQDLSALMGVLESSIPQIDASVREEGSLELEEGCAQARFLFMRMREDLGYHSDFDAYLSASVEEYRKELDGIFASLNKKSNVTRLFHCLDMLLEYSWDVMDYSGGLSVCRHYSSELSRYAEQDDPMIQKVCSSGIQRLGSFVPVFSFMEKNRERIDELRKKLDWAVDIDECIFSMEYTHDMDIVLQVFKDIPGNPDEWDEERKDAFFEGAGHTLWVFGD